MKTYIFNSEHEVYLANAKSLEDAKALISMKYQEASEQFLNRGNPSEKQKQARERYLYLQLKELLKALDESPHIVELGEALIFEHIND